MSVNAFMKLTKDIVQSKVDWVYEDNIRIFSDIKAAQVKEEIIVSFLSELGFVFCSNSEQMMSKDKHCAYVVPIRLIPGAMDYYCFDNRDRQIMAIEVTDFNKDIRDYTPDVSEKCKAFTEQNFNSLEYKVVLITNGIEYYFYTYDSRLRNQLVYTFNILKVDSRSYNRLLSFGAEGINSRVKQKAVDTLSKMLSDLKDGKISSDIMQILTHKYLVESDEIIAISEHFYSINHDST